MHGSVRSRCAETRDSGGCDARIRNYHSRGEVPGCGGRGEPSDQDRIGDAGNRRGQRHCAGVSDGLLVLLQEEKSPHRRGGASDRDAPGDHILRGVQKDISDRRAWETVSALRQL